jgi:hypothetical protein
MKLFLSQRRTLTLLPPVDQDEVGEAPTVAAVVPDDMDVLGAADVVKHVGCFF